MWFGEKLMVEVEARCISDWTPEIPGTEGPPAITVNPPWIRPIPAPDAPLNVRHDNGGTSTPKADRVLWDGVVCPTNTVASYNPNRAGVGYAGWQSALTYNVGTWWGTRYTYTVEARCVSPYISSPNSPESNETGWTTPIPQPSTPTISVPSSQYAGYSFAVTGGGSTCAWPSDTYYDFTNSRDGATPKDRLVGGRGNANASDYWSNTGYVTYSVRIQCRTAEAESPWTAWASDGINIVDPPAPPAPSGGSTSSFTRLCGPPPGFQATVDWSAVSGATSYTVSYNYIGDTGITVTKTVTTTASSIFIYESPTSTSPAFTWSVRSNGPGGSSGYASGVPPQGAGGCQAG